MREDKLTNFANYPQDFYTGSQVKVFFGAIWVDDIATIQWQTNHSKQPLWGYADHQFRAVSKGQFLVNGQFTVVFKETGFLNAIMSVIKNGNQPLEAVTSKVLNTNKVNSPARTLNKYISQGLTIEDALNLAIENGTSTSLGGNTGTSDFEDIAETLEDTIWGKEGTSPNNRITRADELDYYVNTGRGQSLSIDRDGFDILITFGNFTSTTDDRPDHTMSSLTGVHITGESMVISPAGEPLGMTYTFFARGYNEGVSNNWPSSDKLAKDKSTVVAATPSSNTQSDPQNLTNFLIPPGWPDRTIGVT